MGVRSNIDIDNFPKQRSFLNTRVKVCFNYDTNRTVEGTIVRDDAEEPHLG